MKITLPKSDTATSQPTNYYFIVDCSYSMYNSIRQLKDTLTSIKDYLNPQDTCSIAWFSGRGSYDWIIKGANITNANLDQLIQKQIYARGMTNFNEVLSSLVETADNVSILSGNKHNVLVFMTDGHSNDGGTDASIIQVCSNIAAKQTFQEVRIVGYSSYYNRELLVDMAKTLNGQFSHMSNHVDLDKNYKEIVKNKKSIKNTPLDQKYDLLWQVANDVSVYNQKDDNSVDVLDTQDESILYGINWDELGTFTGTNDAKFIYSLALVLSKQNKPNLGVQILYRAGDTKAAKMLQKAFTVAQKGRAENELLIKVLTQKEVDVSINGNSVLLKNWIKDLEIEMAEGPVYIDTSASKYKATTKKKNDILAVDFKKNDNLAKIVKISGNENRPNVNFLTVRKGQIHGINDIDLRNQVDAFNVTTTGNKIEFPIEVEQYKNYTFVSNGDFNFETLCLRTIDPEDIADTVMHVKPDRDIDLFDTETKSIKIQDFVNLNKNLIAEKAHVSVLNWYIKNNSEQKHFQDLRVDKYGAEGAKLLDEMGVDYMMRYSPSKEKETEKKDDNSDYIPMVSIQTYLEGGSKVSANDSFKKYERKGKANVIDNIMWPLFDKYEKMKGTLSKELFVKALQKTLEGLGETVKILSQELASQKFYVISNNAWFEGVEKSDSFEFDGLVINTKIEKEYV